MDQKENRKASPVINVTPLIDVLLVMLIIFMVAAPLKPHRFMAKLPSPPQDLKDVEANTHTLVVTIEPDRTLKLNSIADMGTVDDASNLSLKLIDLFTERAKNHVYRDELRARVDLPESTRIEKTVFIKAPREITYGEVAKVMDALKGTGAEPIGLQLDGLQ